MLVSAIPAETKRQLTWAEGAKSAQWAESRRRRGLKGYFNRGSPELARMWKAVLRSVFEAPVINPPNGRARFGAKPRNQESRVTISSGPLLKNVV